MELKMGVKRMGPGWDFAEPKMVRGTSASSPKSSSIGSAFHGILIPKKNKNK
jgi:hypothetical protein